MRILHYFMWIVISLVFLTSGALMAGEEDILRQKTESDILINLPLTALTEIPVI